MFPSRLEEYFVFIDRRGDDARCPGCCRVVQTTFTVDANTTSLWRFKEGTGTTSANDVTGKPVMHVGNDNWVPGRQYYALALDAGLESNATYAYAADDVSNHPRTAMTVEAWVKIGSGGGDFVCKNGIYFLTLGDGSLSAQFCPDSSTVTATTAHACPPSVGPLGGHLPTNSRSCPGDDVHRDRLCLHQRRPRWHEIGFGVGYRLDDRQHLWPEIVLGNIDWASMAQKWTARSIRCDISSIARVFTPLYPPGPEPATPKGNLVANGNFEIGLTGSRGDSYGDLNLCWETTTGYSPPSGKLCRTALPAPVRRTDYTRSPSPLTRGDTTPSAAGSSPRQAVRTILALRSVAAAIQQP